MPKMKIKAFVGVMWSGFDALSKGMSSVAKTAGQGVGNHR